MLIKQVIGQILWVVLMGLIMGWLARSSRTRRPGQAAGFLCYSRAFGIVAWVCFLFFAGITLLLTIFPREGDSAFARYFIAGFSLLAFLPVVEYHRGWVRLEADGLSYGRWFGGPRTVRWLDVNSASYSAGLMEIRLDTRQGAVVRVSVMMTGLQEFAAAVRREVPESCIDPEARPVLRRTAEGSPPAAWG